MFTGTGFVAPTGSTSRSDSTRSSRACSASGMSPISSRNSVPPSASAIRPRLPLGEAPEKLPGRWPNSSLSIRCSGIAAQFTATKGRARRSLLLCTAFAKNSLPEPVSPVISRLIGVFTSRATRSTCRSSAASPAESAASGAGTARSRCAAATGRGGGGTAERNSSCRPPASITARWSEGCVSTNRPIWLNGSSNSASKLRPTSGGACTARPCKTWPPTLASPGPPRGCGRSWGGPANACCARRL